MNKKVVSSICGIIFLIACGTCSVLYAIGGTGHWWLIVVGAAIACGIITQIGNVVREKDAAKKHKTLIGCICSSICMLSVYAFLLVITLTNFEHSWLIVFLGGISSGIVSLIDSAINSAKNQ